MDQDAVTRRDFVRHTAAAAAGVAVAGRLADQAAAAAPETEVSKTRSYHENAGLIGIKPFASGTIFQSGGTPDSATKQEDDERARLAIRYVLCCGAMHCTIPGLITADQVNNAVAAVKERRQFDLAETQRLQEMVARMWTNLPNTYHWLRDWEWV